MIQTADLSIEPVKARRITVIDALRGFALLGVIIIHMMQRFGFFSGGRLVESRFPAADQVIQWIADNVVMGRFINIFAFLFGLSFFIQMDSASRKGVDFRKRFLWRMAILFTIGMVGNSFFTSDILSIYAFFGVIMVFLFPLKNKILIIIACILLLGTPRYIMLGYDRLTATEQTTATQAATGYQHPSRQSNTNIEKPTFLNSAKTNLTTGFKRKLSYQFELYGRGYITLALFILGLVVGRSRFFEEVHIRQKRNIKLLIGFIAAYIALNVINSLQPYEPFSFWSLRDLSSISFGSLFAMSLNDISIVVFSAILALGFITLYQIKAVGRYLDILTPYGRMGLTNYEMQGVLGAIMFSFWGFGSFFSTLGATELFVLGIIIYISQMLFSKYWLKHFLYGPLEWLWRSGTYLKWQPLRKK